MVIYVSFTVIYVQNHRLRRLLFIHKLTRITRKLYYRTFTLYLRELAEENNHELHGLLFTHKLTRITRKLFIIVYLRSIYGYLRSKPQITLIARISLRELHANYYYRLFTFHLRSFTLKNYELNVLMSFCLITFLSFCPATICLSV